MALLPIDEPALGGRDDHAVLARHVVGRDGHVEARRGRRGNDVEIGEGGLHHHDVGALVDIERDLLERLAAVGRDPSGTTSCRPSAARSRGLRGTDRRNTTRIWRRRRGCRRCSKPASSSAPADRAHPAVHHVGRRHPVDASFGVRERHAAQHLDGLVVGDLAVDHQPVVTVDRVWVERDVGLDADAPAALLLDERSDGGRDDALGVVRRGRALVLRPRSSRTGSRRTDAELP